MKFFQVYHKPPTSFVEGHGGLKRALPSRGIGGGGDLPQAQVIPEPSSLIGDLLSMDLGGGSAAMAAGLGGDIDLLSGGLDIITGNPTAPSAQVNLNRNVKYVCRNYKS